MNSRLDEIQAAILRARLPFLRAWTDRRRALAERYRSALSNATRVFVPPEHDRGHVYHLFVVRCPSAEARLEPGATGTRDHLQAHLAFAGVETLVHYPVAIPKQPALAEWAPASCPKAERAAGEVLSLPLHPSILDRDVDEIARLACGF